MSGRIAKAADEYVASTGIPHSGGHLEAAFEAGAKWASEPQPTPCECTKVSQDETCLVGYPSLLCEVCGGKGHLPDVKLDGPELWEIVFGVNSDAASEITDEQYDRIAKAINDVFITPLRASLSASPTNPPALSE